MPACQASQSKLQNSLPLRTSSCSRWRASLAPFRSTQSTNASSRSCLTVDLRGWRVQDRVSRGGLGRDDSSLSPTRSTANCTPCGVQVASFPPMRLGAPAMKASLFADST